MDQIKLNTFLILVPALKDWNEDLLNSAQEEGESICREIT